MNILPRDEDGKFSKWAWPGGYPLFYLTKQDNCLCPDCANDPDKIMTGDEIVAAGVNWEDASLYCDECSNRIQSAYAEDTGTNPQERV